MYDRLAIVPGVPLALGGPEGGELVIAPTVPAGTMSLSDLQSSVLHLLLEDPQESSAISMPLSDLQARVLHLLDEDPIATNAASMTLADLQNRTWHLLREDGPDTGYPAPTSPADFAQNVVTRDLNLAQAIFISETGITYVGNPLMVLQTDSPVVPAQYQMALVYRVLIDYWARKQDFEQSKNYADVYTAEVKRASRGQGNFSPAQITRDLNIAQQQFISQSGITYVGSVPMVNPTDTPSIPAQYDMALVYRVLSDYWLRKSDPTQAAAYLDRYAKEVERAMRGQGNFTPARITSDLNVAIGEFISETGLAPNLSDRMRTTPVFAVLDQPVPPDLAALYRIEYTPAGGEIYFMRGYSMTEWDDNVGYSLPYTFGQPYVYREPFAGYVRMNPAPGPGNATGDTITWYYSSLGTVMVNPGDTPGIPPQFHKALVYRLLTHYWMRKVSVPNYLALSKRYEDLWTKAIARAKSFTFDSNRATEPTMGDDDSFYGGVPY